MLKQHNQNYIKNFCTPSPPRAISILFDAELRPKESHKIHLKCLKSHQNAHH